MSKFMNFELIEWILGALVALVLIVAFTHRNPKIKIAAAKAVISHKVAQVKTQILKAPQVIKMTAKEVFEEQQLMRLGGLHE